MFSKNNFVILVYLFFILLCFQYTYAQFIQTTPNYLYNYYAEQPFGISSPTINDAIIYQNASGVFEPESKTLLRFGESFFKKGENILRFWHTSAIPPTYKLGPGDELKIIVWSSLGNETVYDVVVNPEGQVYIPILGILGVAGLTLEQFQQTVLGALASKFPHFKGQVTLTKLRTIQIFMVGEVRQPGAMILPAISTALNALYRAGGPTDIGSYRKIKVIRNNKTVTVIDLYNYFTKGDNSSDVYLEDGDTLFVPPTSSLVTVKGEVVRPAIYEILYEQSLSDIILLAGGLKPTAYTTRIKVYRWFGSDKKKIFDIEVSKDISALANFKINSGDEIEVETAIDILANNVTIKGAVLKPGEYAINENTRLSDIIYRAGGLASEANTSVAHIIRKLPQQKEEILAINLEQALSANIEHNVLLKPSDIIVIYYANEVRPIYDFVKILGAVKKPGEYRYRNKMTVRDLALLANGLTLDSSEEAEIISLTTSGKQFVRKIKIKEVISNPKHPENYVLQPLDLVTVKASNKIQLQPKVIEIRGEVYNPGPYTLESEKDDFITLLQKAGGLTQNAFLDGAYILRIYDKAFTKYQEEIINALNARQDDLLRIHLLQNGISSAPNILNTKFIYPSTKETTHTSEFIDSKDLNKTALSDELSKYHIYDTKLNEKYVKIPLKISNNKLLKEQSILSGDIIVIPTRPSTVSVVGAVMNSTTLQYLPKKSANYYIQLAGGFSDFSNHRKAIIIRLNGEVIPMHRAIEIIPGDIIYIPYKVSVIRPDKLKEISQVISILGNLAVTYKALKD